MVTCRPRRTVPRGDVREMRKLVIAFVAMGILALPAHAQRRVPGQGPTPEQIQKQRDAAELDQKYKAAIKTRSEQTTNSKKDPWANMRGPADGKQQ